MRPSRLTQKTPLWDNLNMEFPILITLAAPGLKPKQGNIRHQTHLGSRTAFQMLLFAGCELKGSQGLVCLVRGSPWGPAEVRVTGLNSTRSQILFWTSAQTCDRSDMTSSTLWWNSEISGWSLENSWRRTQPVCSVVPLVFMFLWTPCSSHRDLGSQGVVFIASCETRLVIKTSGSWSCLFFCPLRRKKSFLCSICRQLKGQKVCISHGSGIKWSRRTECQIAAGHGLGFLLPRHTWSVS